jgi:8-oxo-dGTP diphosphatase
MSKYTPIVGTLGYVLSKDHSQVLMIHRNKSQKDDHIGKYNGLGGKMERDEAVSASMAREIFEEAGIVVEEMKFRGTMNWTGFGKNNEDWIGCIFLITKWSGTPFMTCPEGDLEWINLDKIMQYPLWEGDKYFLPLVFKKEEEPFHGRMDYRGEKLISYSFS